MSCGGVPPGPTAPPAFLLPSPPPRLFYLLELSDRQVGNNRPRDRTGHGTGPATGQDWPCKNAGKRCFFLALPEMPGLRQSLAQLWPAAQWEQVQPCPPQAAVGCWLTVDSLYPGLLPVCHLDCGWVGSREPVLSGVRGQPTLILFQDYSELPSLPPH